MKALAATAVLAFVLVPAASAKSSPRVRLALVPLPKTSLGPVARGLKLANDSGGSLRVEENQFFGVPNPATARVCGYALDYGNEGSGRPGVDSVWTTVDEYETPNYAKRALSFWKTSDALLPSLLNDGGLSVMSAQIRLPALGSARLGVLTSYGASNIAPVSAADEVVADGRYLLHVHVAARTAAQAKMLATKFVKRLQARFALALEDRLQATSVGLPPKPKARPPAGGPNLSAMALTASDFTGSTADVEKYLAEPSGAQPDYRATSSYQATLELAGPFLVLDQAIEWFPNANEASFYADRWIAIGEGTPGEVEVDLSSLGDGARGLYANETTSPGGTGVVVFSTGRLAEAIQIQLAAGNLQASDITTVAQTAARKIDTVGGG